VETALQIVGIALALAILWTGLRRLNVSKFWSAALWLLEFLLLGAGVYALGWVGFALAGIATLLGTLAWSVWLAMQKENLLVFAATQCGATKQDMEELHRRLKGSHRTFQQIGQIELARLISLLSQRARTPAEMQQMALPIAMLWIVQECELPWLVEHFDRLLRLYDRPASNSMQVADTLTVATQRSAANFREIVEGMCQVASPISVPVGHSARRR